VTETLYCRDEADARPRLDRFDARTRIVTALALIVAALVVRSPFVLMAGLAGLVAFAWFCELRAKEIAGRLLHAEGFLLVLLILLPLTVPGPAALSLGPVELSAPGLDRALKIFLRVNFSALAVLILLAGMEPVRFGHALAGLGVPEKLAHLLLFAARWVALTKEEGLRLHDAMRARAFKASTSLHTFRTLGFFCGQLLVRALERAERIDEAMRCRGFAGRFVLAAEERPGRSDGLFAAGAAVAIIAAVALDRLT
jgi:cobalt/nickel transport system permease protein